MKDLLLHKKLNCPVSEAWEMWTTPTLLNSFFGEQSKVELKKDGAFEIYFSMKFPAGERGSENCTIIDFEKNKSLSFTWNAPPSIPKARNSGLFTKVGLEFKKEDDKSCTIELKHFGWDYKGDHWEKTNAYFKQAWPYVLDQMEQAVNQKK